MPNDTTVAALNTADIQDSNRIRGDYGDIAGLVSSIREFGIIQPIVIQRQQPNGNDISLPYLLVAGGRRLAALRQLGTTSLRHGVEFIWRDEDVSTSEGKLRLQALELEENLKRKSLTWSEEVLGKKRLLEIMESIHGSRKWSPRPGIEATGFGVRTLASLLGENEATTSRDIQMARYVEKVPALGKLPTKQDAFRKLGVAVTIASMQASAASSTPDPAKAPQVPDWRLYRGKFQDSISQVADSSVDLVATDLPYDIGVGGSTSAHAAGLNQFLDSHDSDTLSDMLHEVAGESYRILAPNRYAVFFFGVDYYVELKQALEAVGFTVDPYWFIWSRNRTAPPSPARYAKRYDPALIASKGSPVLLRPNLGNLLEVPSVSGADRLHSAQKPVAVMEHFILDMTAPGSTVVDLMAGSGTTGVAALKNKRKAILFEKEEPNCVLIESRLRAIK